MKKYAYSMVLLSFALSASAQDLEQKVSYTGPAAPAKKILEALSEQAGFELSTSPQTASDVLVVVAKDVKLGELLKRIAQADGAEWKQESSGFRLIRTEALAREQQRADIAERAKGYSAAVQKLVAAAEGAAFDAAAARRLAENARRTQAALETGSAQRNVREPQGKDPAARAIARLLADLPAATLASIAPNTRVVFANIPNRMQRPLGPQSSARLLAFVREQNLWARALADTPRETSGGNNQLVMFGGPDLSARAIDRIGKALLVVQRFSERPTLTVELKVSDSTGKFVARASETLTIEAPTATGAAPSSASAAKPITLSSTAKEFATLMVGPGAAAQSSDRFVVRIASSLGGGGNMSWSSGGSPPAPPVSEEWAKRLSQPAANEPLDYVTGEVLRAVAADLGTALVASIPDGTLIPTCRRMLNAKLSAEQFLGYAESALGLKVTRSDGWTLLSAAFPSEVRDTRVERLSLGQLLRTAIKNTYLRLDEMAGYALRQPDGLTDGSFDDRFIRLLAPDASQDFAFNGADRRLMLKLYGTLNSAQRSTLAQGGGIAFGRMDARQNALVAKMVFDSPSGPQIAKPTPPENNPRGGQRVDTRTIAVLGSSGAGGAMFAMPGSDQELIDERTEALPFGIVGDGAMQLSIQSRPGALSTRKDGSDARFLSAEDLASEMAAASRPELSEGTQPYTAFRMATIRTLDFQFAVSPAATMARELRDAEMAGTGRAVGFDQLPDPFRQMVERQAEQMARALGNIRTGGPLRIGGSPPPPPLRS